MLAPSFVFTFVSCITLGTPAVQGYSYKHAARDAFSSTNGLKTRPVQSAASASSGSATGLINNGDVWYLAEITLGGSQFIVQLDSGSTDLVLFPDRHIETQSVIKDSQINATYGTGWTAGPIAVAKLEFGGYTIESQAFLNGTSISDWDIQYSLPLGIRGIMGVALDTSFSWIHDELDSLYESQQAQELGRNALANIFHQDARLGNFTVVLLGRTDDGEGTGEGYLGIGEYPDGFEDFFTNIKPIDTFTPTDWSVPVDSVGVNGRMAVSLKSAVKGAPAGKAIANLDTGTGAASVSKEVLDAMYGGIQDAWWSDDFEAWVVPCLQGAPNITFTIGGQAYLIHPLDLTDVQDLRPDYNYTVCTSTFDVLDFDNDEFDFLLGDSFLRNAYASFYYGAFDAKGDVVKSPSVKLLSPSNGADATYADFLSRRHQNLASLPPEATKAQLQKAFSQVQSQSKASDASVSENAVSTSGDDAGSYQALIDKLDTFAPVVIGMLGAIFVVLLGLLGLGITMCIRRGRTVGSGRSLDPTYAPVPLRFKEPESQYKDEENVRYHQ
ncbi:acid protease [Peniophora sp. CONT]|nr:acid protease [Peniophora sp. CONT]